MASGGESPAVDVSSTKAALLTKLHEEKATKGHKKVTIVGAGAVGVAAAYSIINQGICSELALVDVMADRLKGEVMDLAHGAAYTKRMTIKGSPDYAVSADSDLVIITAGARQREGESRLELVDRNLAIFKGIVPEVVKYSPQCSICVVSNPVDLMTAVTARLAGFPPGRVFGSGTSLDSSRFRQMVAERLGLDTRSVHGFIIGEHGDSSVAVWSSVTLGGTRLHDLNPKAGKADDPENWKALHHDVIQSAYEVIKLKGFTNFAIGLTLANISECVLRNEHRVLPVSVPVKGKYGIEADVYLSLPAVVAIDGVSSVISLPLEESEQAALRASAEAIAKVQAGLHW